MESEKANALEDKGLAKGKRPLGDDGGGGDIPESGERPKGEKTKLPKFSTLSSLEKLYYQEYIDHQDSITSDNALATSTRQLVSKASDDDHVKSLLNSIIYRMRLKWFKTEHLILRKRIMDDNIPLDSPLGESCVNSVAALLSRFQDNCRRLKELEATTKSQKERKSEDFVRAASANTNLNPILRNLKLTPRLVILRSIPGTAYLEVTPM
ncbi:hypothetical protein FEM48_Zijuj04G0190300 [Ziziphus jujuba var. spinosa]|uniref:Uncharacterized protein n=1 Tax=Ziziphus jujuba var. spinosa TaxID=714518 RepID=A0A978VLM1_ZIZJJ|nr:hypothetical protein FEM48_Zijuj04G0190300 [Ziziphus jujuba var. spinosa]